MLSHNGRKIFSRNLRKVYSHKHKLCCSVNMPWKPSTKNNSQPEQTELRVSDTFSDYYTSCISLIMKNYRATFKSKDSRDIITQLIMKWSSWGIKLLWQIVKPNGGSLVTKSSCRCCDDEMQDLNNSGSPLNLYSRAKLPTGVKRTCLHSKTTINHELRVFPLHIWSEVWSR